jgi:hypothetical protein
MQPLFLTLFFSAGPKSKFDNFPLQSLRQLVGHSSIETTAGYRRPVIEQASNPLDDLLNRTTPAAQPTERFKMEGIWDKPIGLSYTLRQR